MESGVVFWMLGIGLSSAAMAVCAGLRSQGGMPMAYLHMLVTAAVCIALTASYIRESRKLRVAGASGSAVAANTAEFCGIVWAWGALAIVITYATGILVWREWWEFFAGFAVAASLSLMLSASLKRDARMGRDDATMLEIGRYLAIGQLAGMVITVAGLLIDGKMSRYLVPRYTDWAANNVFFFGALAIAAISGYALITKQMAQRA